MHDKLNSVIQGNRTTVVTIKLPEKEESKIARNKIEQLIIISIKKPATRINK